MKNEPLISIVVPVYNVEKYLQRCLDSLLAQTFNNIEIILVDDGSTDHSLTICQRNAETDTRIRFFSKENGGLSDARNFGISVARGKWVSFVDSDDYVDADYIEYLYTVLIKNNATMAICSHRTVYRSGKIRVNSHKGSPSIDSHTAIERMLYDDQIDTSAWAKLYPIQFFKNISFPKGRLFEDIATTYKTFLAANRIAVGSDAKYNYLFRDDSIVNKTFSLKKLDLIFMTRLMTEEVEKVYPDLHRPCKRRMLYAYISTLNQMNGVTDHQNIRSQIIANVKKLRKPILSDRKAPARDKAAIVLICVSYPLYAKVWRWYLKLKKGEEISA